MHRPWSIYVVSLWSIVRFNFYYKFIITLKHSFLHNNVHMKKANNFQITKFQPQGCLAFDFLPIHGFTISVPVLILPVFWQLLLRNGKISSKCLFWNERTQRADSRWQQQSYFTSISINFSIIYMFKLVLYFNSVIISNQIKYYLARNRGIFCKYSIATVSNDSFLLKEHVPRIQGR